jgi:Ser/Thr protein kinase RdoA (MazF antagonist)
VSDRRRRHASAPGSARASLTPRALRAAVAVAARHGLRGDKAVVLSDASNLLVWLRPAPVVARVATVTSTVRRGDAWLAREVAVASHLAAAGAPVVAPSAEIAAGPHRHDGFALSFWTYVDEAATALDAREAGARLRLCHDALTSFADELPRMAALDEAQATLERLAAAGSLDEDDAALLRRAGSSVRERIDRLAAAMQPIHGDAHLHNVVNGPDGPLWNDWEDAFLGPRAWDLGCLHASARAFGRDPGPVAAAQDGYGDLLDAETLDTFVDARRLQGTVWSVVMSLERPDRRERAASLIGFYRDRA